MKVNDIVTFKPTIDKFKVGEYSPNCYIITHCKALPESELYELINIFTKKVLPIRFTMKTIESMFIIDPYRNNNVVKSLYV